MIFLKKYRKRFKFNSIAHNRRQATMPGGGLLALVSYGSQNVILNGNPEFTYFYKVFKRYSHFSMENATIPLEGPNELFYDQPIRLRAKIPRIADLVTDMVFAFDVPPIYSKFVTFTNQRQSQYEFQWNNYLGASILQNVGFYVGGNKIQEFDSDYIIAKAHADMDTDTFQKFRYLVGEVPEMTDPAKGVYAGGELGKGYPTVIRNTAVQQQVNRPSIEGQTLYVPLPLWFSESASRALPLVALQYHECEIQLSLRPIQELYSILDPSGYRVRPGYRVNSPQALNAIGQPNYVSDYDPSGEFRAFATDIGVTPPLTNSWFFNPRLEANYIYLTDSERKIFASQPLNYLVNQITTFRFNSLYTRTLYDLEVSNPITRLLLLPRRSDSFFYRNQVANYTNWLNPNRAPWVSTPGATIPQNVTISSGLAIPASQQQILRSLRVLLDGNEIQEEKPISYYVKVQPFRMLTGASLPDSQHLPSINFALSSPTDQPSGSVNASRIRLFQLDVDPYPLPLNPSYVYELIVFAENINFFTVESGYGGVKYAL
jgi:hypothetical protein